MLKPLKITWDIVQKILPDPCDDESVVMLSRSQGKMTTIPVKLYKGSDRVLRADVSLFSSQEYLYTPALAVLLRKFDKYGLPLEWDGASSHNDAIVPRDKIELNGNFAMIVKRSVDRELIVTLKEMREVWRTVKKLMDTDYKPDNEGMFKEFCAAIIGAGAIVKSEDMERMIAQRQNPALKEFVPQGIEL